MAAKKEKEEKTKKTTEKKEATKKVKVTSAALNVRKEADINSKSLEIIRDGGEYEITEEKEGFGKLKNKAGWIKLEFTEDV